MKSRHFIIGFVVILLLIVGSIVGFNLVTNPYGLVGKDYYKWESYNFTKNPRIAKIAYLDQHHEKYNAYIIGSSGASAFPTDTLGAYNNKKNYNLFYYGADMYDSLNTVKYIVENYEVDEIFMPIGFSSTLKFHTTDENMNFKMDPRVEKESYMDFYKTYLLAHPEHGIEKIKARKEDSYFQKGFDVFLPESGLYDKRLRDVEYIGTREEYYENFQGFQGLIVDKQTMGYIEEATSAIAQIKDVCDKNDIKLTVVLIPMLEEVFNGYPEEGVSLFYEQLGEITDYWDFTYTSISKDPRYFYNPAHFRNDVGRMMLAKIYNDSTMYVPEDFGIYVKKGTKRTRGDVINECKNMEEEEYTAKIPVLLMHHFDENLTNSASITKEKLLEVCTLLQEKGYTTIDYYDIDAYVNHGVDLPSNPIMLTLDDGYLSNYDIFYPVMQEFQQKATILMIGSSIGKDTYKDTGVAIYEHFTMKQAKEMHDSPHIYIGSHSFDMHQAEQLEENPMYVRKSMVQIETDTEESYIKAIREDFALFASAYKEMTEEPVEVLAYPLGEHDKYISSLLAESGIKCTFTTVNGSNTIIKGLPQTLYNLKRNNVGDGTNVGEMLEKMLQ